MANLLNHFADAVARHADRTAIVEGNGREVTFREVQKRAQQLASKWSRKGLCHGDRVLLAMPVNADLYASLAALWSLGVTVVLPEPAMGLAGLRHAARTTRPKAFCASGYFALLRFVVPELLRLPLLRPGQGQGEPSIVDVQDSDVALISFTSGTTGQAKAIPRSHAFLMAQHDAIAPLLDSDAAERDLVAFPVFTLINLATGRTTILPNWKMTKLDRLSPEQLAGWVSKQQVTRLLIPPSLCEKLAQCKDTGQLHTVFTGGGPVFPDLTRRLLEQSGLDVVCVYGSTEAEPIAHLNAREISDGDHRDMAAGRGLLVGRPVSHIKLRIRDDEVQVAGDHVNDGYLDPAHSKENKIKDGSNIWHRTGDAGHLDERGRLWLLGRLGSDVKTPTRRIFPFAVEIAAHQWPGMTNSALMSLNGSPVLCVEGDADNLSNWNRLAQEFGVAKVTHVKKIPMDKRHRSKIDRVELAHLLGY
ncbi:AMP-binding protein [Ruegeria arenilitoris]|uniref:AMP-binding protein n=1 Tax=Ruegeria arenilitoris TaxID=1173585 RepID=UPI00147DA8B8|nr:AMP-binding protein [Ruegeria arenilitoris]